MPKNIEILMENGMNIKEQTNKNKLYLERIMSFKK
jgi:hypothetical protein